MQKLLCAKNPIFHHGPWDDDEKHSYKILTSGPYPPFTPVIRSTTSADKAIKNSMLCPAALSHQNSYFGLERGRLTLPELTARWRQSRSCD